MDHIKARKEIIKQAKKLRGKIPENHPVYIHWKNDSPLVLPMRTPGFDLINTVSLSNILNKRLILTY